MRRISLVVLFVGTAHAQPGDPLVDPDIKGPVPEVMSSKVKLALPPLPSFELPKTASGLPSIKERALQAASNADVDGHCGEVDSAVSRS